MLKKKRFTAVFLAFMLFVGLSGAGTGKTTVYAEELQNEEKAMDAEEAVMESEEAEEQEQVESIGEDVVARDDSEATDNERSAENEVDVLLDAENNVLELDVSEIAEKDKIFDEEKREVFRENGSMTDIYITDSGVDDLDDLPVGVSYNVSTDTLLLNNANIGCISIYRTRDLNIKVSGENIVRMIFVRGEWLDEEHEEFAYGDIFITGTGTIHAQRHWVGGFFGQMSLDSYDDLSKLKHGDIYIDGVTFISDVGLIESQYGNVTIRNAIVKIDNNYQETSDFGITTGRASENEKYGGRLTIENSEIEIKNCPVALAWNELNASGCNYYLGKSSPEYQADLEKICWYSDYNSFKRGVISDIDYLKITPKKLGLPKAYELIDGTGSKAKGSISFPDGIYMEGNGKEISAAGRKVRVTVKPDSGYQLSKLYVNGKAISGTSFTMPAKDTTVKAEFVKKKVKVTGIKITAPSKKIAAGKKAALSVKVTPAAADNKKVTWSVSNKRYASVNSKGVVTMKKADAGKTVTVTAKAKDGSGKKSSVKIRIMKGVVKKIKLTAAKSVKAGRKVAVKAKVTASKGANKTLTYSVSNKKYASVNSKGVVTAKKAGKGRKITVTAKATDGSNKKAVIKIKIK